MIIFFRTMVQESTGGRTLVTSAVSVFMLLWVILFIGPLFYHLPKVRHYDQAQIDLLMAKNIVKPKISSKLRYRGKIIFT